MNGKALTQPLRHPLTSLQRLDWRWLLAAGFLMGAGSGWLLVDSGGLGWVGVVLLLAVGLWLGREAEPRLAVPLVDAAPNAKATLPQVVVDGKLEMVELPGGAFLMGSPAGDEMANNDERPQHRVTVSGFRIGRTTVTDGLYRQVMADGQGEDTGVPVIDVAWSQAVEFCNRLSRRQGYRPCYRRSRSWLWRKGEWRCDWSADGYRLPTEAEWEYACRAGSGTRWSFGDDDGVLGEYAWFGANSEDKSHTVAQKHPNPWGLFDMHGNVWEWCWDWYGGYRRFERHDPRGPRSGRQRVLRGGSFWAPPRNLRSAFRYGDLPEVWVSYDGFRCVRVPARQP